MRALSESERFDLQLTLLDKHTRQHADLRKKIHLTTERFVTLMIALTTLVDTDIVHFSYTNATKTVSTVVVTIIMIAIVYMICKDHKSSLKNARIVSSLNEEFGLFSSKHPTKYV